MAVVVAIVGATATGKTDLAESLAAALGGEVVCADARQVYRGLEIGSGAPTPARRAALPHHLFGALALGERGNAGWFAQAATLACDAIVARGRIPVLAGGSGLWLSALRDGLHDEPAHDPRLRAELLAALASGGAPALHARLASLDPGAAARLHAADGQRIVRALEVRLASGVTIARWRAGATRRGYAADWRVLELTCEPGRLRERIARRTTAMYEGGLLEETRALADGTAREALAALHAIGYDEALAVLEGRLTREAAEVETNRRTALLAKRQRTWFRHQIEATRLPVDAPGGVTEAGARRALELGSARGG
ncbi:MAG TPA: tRNA (adenosine(37)-N6)-dimethylallyltransferase MiaA [Candidatus Acidoferrales bacterium]|nr:tRNA (adenosine(37)-N6)-dimethylallyltransferase MiaA [Candidatus Acidoferrales bacterium]